MKEKETAWDRLKAMTKEEREAAIEEATWGRVRRAAAEALEAQKKHEALKRKEDARLAIEALNQERIAAGWGFDIGASKNADRITGITLQELSKKAPQAMPMAKPERLSSSPLVKIWEVAKPLVPSKTMMKIFPRKVIYGALVTISGSGIAYLATHLKECISILANFSTVYEWIK